MTILKYLLCFSFLLNVSSVLTAAHHKKTVVPNEITLKQKLQSKKEIVKSYFSKKRLNKKEKTDDERISNGAIITILLGCLVVSAILFAVYLVSPIPLIVMLAAAIVGSIFGLRTWRLIKKSDNPKRYQVSKIMTLIGLIPSLIVVAYLVVGLIVWIVE